MFKVTALFAEELELPGWETTRDGIRWKPGDANWIITSPSMKHNFGFEKAEGIASAGFITAFKLVIIHYLKNFSIAHAFNQFNRMLAFLRFSSGEHQIEEIDDQMVLRFRTSLSNREEHHLGAMRGMLENWVCLGYPGVHPNVKGLFRELKLKGNTKGEAVQTMDPERGPFSDMEFEAIISNLNDKFAAGLIELDEFILVWMYLALGSRSVQLACLKLKDFLSTHTESGASAYYLKVPRAKQRGASPRSEFKARRIIPEIGRLVEQHVDAMRSKQGDLVASPDELPFFLNLGNDSHAMPDLRFHCTSFDLDGILESVFKRLAIQSERTGRDLLVNSRRFRYTRGTRAAAEGASELVIAELLDHSDTQQVGVYVKSVPKILERIDRAMAVYLAPVAQAFAGQLITDESQARRKGDPRSKIVTPEALAHPVGNCGSYGFCGANAPIACYTCRNFQPWKDGPHEAVLESLLQERKRVYEATGDLTIASINDRTIFACAEVVRRCEVNAL